VSSLLAAELRRFFSRRLVLAFFAFGIALSTLVLVILTVRSDFRSGSQSGSGIVCSSIPDSAPATVTPGSGTLPPGCTFENQFPSVLQDHRLKIGDNYSDTVGGAGAAMVFAAFVIGASFIGAEFGAASLSTQLIFEPRRARVVVAKAVAVAIGTAALAVAVLLWIGVLQWGGSQLRGVVHGLDGSWFAARAGDIGRVAAAVGLAAATSYAITVVTRRTVAAVAGLLVAGWVAAIVGNLASWHWVGKFNPATAFVIVAVNPRLTAVDRSRTLTTGGAAVSACVWTIGLCVIGIVVFGRREVR
jgi:hypothetical protein